MTLNLYYNILHSHELGVSQYISQYGFSIIPVIAMIFFGVSLHPFSMAAICIGSLHVKKNLDLKNSYCRDLVQIYLFLQLAKSKYLYIVLSEILLAFFAEAKFHLLFIEY